MKKAEYAPFRQNSHFYESEDKSGKLLVRHLHQKKKSCAMPAIKNDKGELVTNTRDIYKVFANFSDHLYKFEANPEVDDYRTFFSKINLPEMSMDQKEHLESFITQGEVKSPSY